MGASSAPAAAALPALTGGGSGAAGVGERVRGGVREMVGVTLGVGVLLGVLLPVVVAVAVGVALALAVAEPVAVPLREVRAERVEEGEKEGEAVEERVGALVRVAEGVAVLCRPPAPPALPVAGAVGVGAVPRALAVGRIVGTM